MAYRKEHKGELRYKIILNNSDKLTILEEELLKPKKCKGKEAQNSNLLIILGFLISNNLLTLNIFLR
jgi:hypothetical protein